MADSTDSEVQFNLNVNRTQDPLDDRRDVVPGAALPNPDADDDALEENDPRDVDLVMNAGGRRGALPNPDDDDDGDDDDFLYQPVGYRRSGRNHGDGVQNVDVPSIQAKQIGRGRPRNRLAAIDRQQRRRYDSDSDAYQTPRRARRVLPTIKPETYDGSSDWESYLSHFTNCAELGRWTDEEKALTLASCLCGSARVFYLGLREPEQRIYRTFVNRMGERFGSKNQQARYITKFESRRREVGEPVASFGDDLRLTARRAYPDLDVACQDSLALHQFYKTLNPEMKCRCIDRDCKNIEQAVEIVERYESILGVGDKKKAVVRTVTEAESQNENQNKNQNRNQNQNRYSNKNYNAGHGAKNSTEASLMRQMQHIMSRLETMENNMCATNTKQQGEFIKPRQPYSGCFLCQSMDHFARDCPQKQMFNQAKSGNAKPLA